MTGGAVVLEVDLDRDPRAQPGVTLEQDPRSHRRRVRRPPPRAGGTAAPRAQRERRARRRGRAIREARDGTRGLQCGAGLRSQHRRLGPPKSCAPSTVTGRSEPGRGSDARGYRTIPPQRSASGISSDVASRRGSRPVVAASSRGDRAPDPSVPRPPVCVRARRATSAAVVAPPYDVIGADEHARAARPPPGERRPPRPAVDRARRRARRALSAGGADARRVALRRDASQGPAIRDLRLRADLSRPGHGRRADAARVLRPAAARDVRAGRRGPAATSGRSRAARGPLPAAAGDRRQHEPGRRPVRRPDPGRAPRVLATLAAGEPDADVVDDDGVRHRLWVVEADGPAADRVAALLDRRRAGPVTIADGHHRYETALRYRDERRMSRSCEEDPAFDYLLMLLARGDRRAADDPADPPRRPRSRRRRRRRAPARARRTCSRSGRPIATELLARVRAARSAEGGDGRFGLVDARRRLDPTARREAFASDAATGRRRRSRRSTPGCSAWPWSAPRASTRRPSRAATDRLHEVRRGGARRSSTPATDGADAAFLLEPDAGRVGRRPSPDGRRHAPEVDLLLSEGPDGPRHQPARMVTSRR